MHTFAFIVVACLFIFSLPIALIVWREMRGSCWRWLLSLLALCSAPLIIAFMVGSYSLLSRYCPTVLDLMLGGDLSTTRSLYLPALVLNAPLLLGVWYLAKKAQKSAKKANSSPEE